MCLNTHIRGGNTKSDRNAKFYSTLGRNTDVAHMQNLENSVSEGQKN